VRNFWAGPLTGNGAHTYQHVSLVMFQVLSFYICSTFTYANDAVSVNYLAVAFSCHCIILCSWPTISLPADSKPFKLSHNELRRQTMNVWCGSESCPNLALCFCDAKPPCSTAKEFHV